MQTSFQARTQNVNWSGGYIFQCIFICLCYALRSSSEISCDIYMIIWIYTPTPPSNKRSSYAPAVFLPKLLMRSRTLEKLWNYEASDLFFRILQYILWTGTVFTPNLTTEFSNDLPLENSCQLFFWQKKKQCTNQRRPVVCRWTPSLTCVDSPHKQLYLVRAVLTIIYIMAK
jgi:hypothetical protein